MMDETEPLYKAVLHVFQYEFKLHGLFKKSNALQIYFNPNFA